MPCNEWKTEWMKSVVTLFMTTFDKDGLPGVLELWTMFKNE